MTIKNKRKNQKKYWNSYKGQSQLFREWRQELEEKYWFGTHKLQQVTK